MKFIGSPPEVISRSSADPALRAVPGPARRSLGTRPWVWLLIEVWEELPLDLATWVWDGMIDLKTLLPEG